MRGSRFLAMWLAVCAGFGALGGCGGDSGSGQSAGDRQAWFPDCPTSSIGTPTVGRSMVPSEPLPCIEGDARIDLAAPSGVATVVNVWASWCAPCRAELPVFQRYADRAGTQVRVLGVVSRDTRQAATALARELGVRFPTLYDDSGRLMRRLGRTALPVTLFINPDGGMAYLYNSTPLSDRELARLTEIHLGVAVGT